MNVTVTPKSLLLRRHRFDANGASNLDELYHPLKTQVP